MDGQTTFADLEYAARRRTTRRDEFLALMDEALPWGGLVALIKPHYYKGERGRRPIGIERMLRMYFLQLWYGLSDEGVEDAIYDSRAFSQFVGVKFGSGDQVPDATTLLKFRRIIEDNGLAGEMLACVNGVLEEKGVMMRGGSIVDATFVEAPSSTKNAAGERDPEMHSAKKGNNWHFGCKAHVGVDAGSGLVHTAVYTPANVNDVAVAHELVREDDEFCYADSGYTGVAKREEVASDPHLSQVDWVVAAKPSTIKGMPGLAWEHTIESRKASVRSKVEHVFQIVKRQFGYSKCRYRGIAKNASALTVCFALANVAMWARAGCPALPAETPA